MALFFDGGYFPRVCWWNLGKCCRRRNSTTPLHSLDDSPQHMLVHNPGSPVRILAGAFPPPTPTQDCLLHHQLCEFQMLPFGPCNATTTFARLMNAVLKELTWLTCLAFLDDIIVFGRPWEEHLLRYCSTLGRWDLSSSPGNVFQ